METQPKPAVDRSWAIIIAAALIALGIAAAGYFSSGRPTPTDTYVETAEEAAAAAAAATDAAADAATAAATTP